ncbi:OsmC family protein [Streptomyces sp. NPDC051940]|uniref:OsmC family protein n=1 Tax=Streptomyces sp. NPDC051940 TaxID=3155675 RepID=UPI0034494AE2
MATEYPYEIRVRWSGGPDSGTRSHEAYPRAHEITAAGPPPIPGSADVGAFRGDADRWNPEQLLTAAVAQAHLLWYLHLCTADGVVVTSYEDTATGLLVEGDTDHVGEVVLRPRVTVADPATAERARALHAVAVERSFVANSVRFPVRVEAHVTA